MYTPPVAMARLLGRLRGLLAAVVALGPSGVVERQRRRWRDRRDYARWLSRRRGQAPSPVDTASVADGPLFSVLMPTHDSDLRWLDRAVASVRAQAWPRWELCIADDASSAPGVRERLRALEQEDDRIRVAYRLDRGHISAASNTALSLARGPFVALLDHDDELAPEALRETAAALERHPSADLLYSDEDKIDLDGRHVDVYLKPDWSPDLLLSQNLVSHLGVYRTDLVRAVGAFREGYEGAQDHDLALRVVERSSAERVVHVPSVLYHWRTTRHSTSGGLWRKGYAVDAGCRAIADHLARTGKRASVERTSYAFYRVRYALPDPAPRVTLVAVEPVRADLARLDLRGLTVEVRRVASTARVPLAAAIDSAVRDSRGDVVVLLGPDCRPRPGWLVELVSQAARPEVGVAGGKVVSRWGRIRHGGYLLALERESPILDAHRGVAETARGHFGRANLIQNFLAVSADSLAFRREVYLSLGGVDTKAFPEGLFDVDLCLRAWESGRRVVFTPHAAVTQGRSTWHRRQGTDAECRALRERWLARVPHDPYWHPLLDRASPDFRLPA
jgi:glycosyltransferase involved in cell wall biosynthesis